MKFSPLKKKFVVSSFVLCVVLLTACDNEKGEKKKMPPSPVEAVVVLKKDWPINIEVPARVQGSFEVQVQAQVSGIIRKRLFNEGQYVKKGDSLFIIDQEPYKAALQKASGSLKIANSEFERSKKEYDRVLNLYEANAVSKKTYDEITSMFEKAKANVSVAKAMLDEAKINFEYTKVKAPISGIVGKEEKTVGNLVSPANGLLTSITKISPLHVTFSVPGNIWESIKQKFADGKITLPDDNAYEVELIMPDGGIYNRRGKVIFIDKKQDLFTASVSMKAEVKNSIKDKTLLAGQFIRVRLLGIHYNSVVVIPVSSLIHTGNGFIVYVLDKDGKAEVRPVKIIEYVGNKVIIEGGVNDSEVVVSSGVIKVRPGQIVKPVIKSNP